MNIACILLASGYGRRYGGNKLLALREGVPLYRRAFAALPPALFSPAVVTSQYGQILADAGRAGYAHTKLPPLGRGGSRHPPGAPGGLAQ